MHALHARATDAAGHIDAYGNSILVTRQGPQFQKGPLFKRAPFPTPEYGGTRRNPTRHVHCTRTPYPAYRYAVAVRSRIPARARAGGQDGTSQQRRPAGSRGRLSTPHARHTYSLALREDEDRGQDLCGDGRCQRAWGGDDPRVSGWPQLQCTAAWRSAWVAQPHFAAPSRWQDRCPRRKRGHLRSE